jgi:hypothetical protein
MPDQFNVLTWLDNYLQNVPGINPEKINAITNFSLMWNLFESVLGNNTMSIQRISQIATLISTKDNCNDFYREYFSYFKDRYVDEIGNTKAIFNNLAFRANDKKDFVEQTLKSEGLNAAEAIEALLIIIYRLRNNLFHGEKELHTIHTQYENFNNANLFLSKLLDIHKAG